LPYGDTDTGENGNGDPTGLPSDLSGYSKLDLFALRAGLGYPWSPSKTTNMPTANSTLQNPSGAVPSPILKPSELDDIKNILKQFSDVKGEKEIQWNGKFFDDPQDYDMIEYGYRLYMENQGK